MNRPQVWPAFLIAMATFLLSRAGFKRLGSPLGTSLAASSALSFGAFLAAHQVFQRHAVRDLFKF